MRQKLLSTIFICTSIIGARAQSQQDTSYTLEEFRALALAQSKEMQISQERIKIATELKKAAFTQFFPNFSANGTYIWNQKSMSLLSEDALLPIGSAMPDGSFGFRPEQIKNTWTSVGGQPVPLDADGKPFNPKTNPEKIIWKDYAYLPKEAMEFDTQNIFAGGIGFVQPIFMGNKVRELYRISKSGEKLAQIGHQREEQDLLVEVDEAYWRTISIINKQKLAQKFVELVGKLNRDVELMLKEGVATKGDLLNVRVKLNEANVALTKANNGVRLSKMALLQLCGLNMNGNYSLKDEDINQQVIKDTNFDIESVIDKRPEIKMLEEMTNIAKSNINLSRSRFMPNLVLSANYLISNPNVFNGFSTKFSGMFSAGVALNIPIFHFGDKVHTLRAAKANYNIANYQLDKAKEMIELQLNQYTFKIAEANKKLEAALSNISAADENLKLAGEAYKEGLISVTEYMQAQTAWVSANSERIDAGIDVRMCELYLNKAKGDLVK